MSRSQSWWEQSDWKDLPDWDGADEYIDDGGKNYCRHSWKKIVLVVSTVYDCEFCGVKAEDVGIKIEEPPKFELIDRSRK